MKKFTLSLLGALLLSAIAASAADNPAGAGRELLRAPQRQGEDAQGWPLPGFQGRLGESLRLRPGGHHPGQARRKPAAAHGAASEGGQLPSFLWPNPLSNRFP